MVYTQEVATKVFLIDDELYNIPRSGAVYFLAEEKKALIDTGPSTSSDIVLQGIRQTGFQRPEAGTDGVPARTLPLKIHRKTMPTDKLHVILSKGLDKCMPIL